MITKDKLRQVNDRPIHKVPVPEWDDTVNLRVMTGNQLAIWNDAAFKRVNQKSRVAEDTRLAREMLLAMTICDDDGVLVFDHTNADDLNLLSSKSGTVIDRLYDEAYELNKLGPKQVAETAKNLNSSPTSAS